MITLIHGSNVAATRNHLLGLYTQYEEIIFLNGQKLDFSELIQSLESASLFSQKKLIVVENFFHGRLNRDVIIKYLAANKFDHDIVFWDSREAGIKDFQTMALKNRVIKINLNSVIFKFLDSLLPGNQTICLKLFDEALLLTEVEVLFFLIVKQVRYLLLSIDQNNGPVDFQRLLPWQKAKLTKQASLFNLDRLVKFYQDLLTMDFDLKNGKSSREKSKDLKYLILKLQTS